MKEFPIPVVGFGAGSQEDEGLEYLPLPSDMATFRMPYLNHESDPQCLSAACHEIATLRDAMSATPMGSKPAPLVELAGLPEDVVKLINQSLGEGEVSVMVREPLPLHIQETVFAGVWCVLEYGRDGQLTRDSLTACAIPQIVVQSALMAASLQCKPATPPPGVMNAPALINEILHKSSTYTADSSVHVINLTLLPVTTEDLDYLTDTMGIGPVAILSRGYGNCRITSTLIPNVWWVQYFNSMDTLILNTIEVAAIPEVAVAAREDYEASTERLSEWLAAMAQD